MARSIFIIDLMPFLYKGHFVFLRNPRITSGGLNTSALVGFANSVGAILKDHAPTHVALAMDPVGPTFRHKAYPAYKAQREKMPEDLAANIPRAFELAEALGIPVVRQEGFEADDVMGTLARLAADAGFDEVTLATPDKDAAQLVTEKIRLFRPGHGKDPAEIYDAAKVCEHWSLASPRQMIDYLALAGDTADNIPGVRGVGEKTAVQLLKDWGDLDGILAHAAEIPGKLGEKIAAATEDAKMSRFLTEIRTDVPLAPDWEQYRRRDPDLDKLKDVCARYELFAIARKFGLEISGAEVAARRPVTPEGASADGIEAPKIAYKTLADVPHDYRLVTTEVQARELAAALEAAPRFAFDTETDGTDARRAMLVGMSFATEPGRAWYVAVPPHAAACGTQDAAPGGSVRQDDLFASSSVQQGDLFAAAEPPAASAPLTARHLAGIFAAAFADPKKTLVAQNGKFDRAVLERYGIRFGSVVHDTMLEHYVTDAAARHGMDTLAREYLHYDPIPIENLIGVRERGKEQRKMSELAPETVCDYACEDADVTLRLEDVLRPAAEKAGCLKALEESEEPLVSVLVEMERTGVRIDTAALRAYGVSLDREVAAHLEAIRAVADPGINVDSPKQLGALLFDKLKLDASLAKKTATGQYSTDEKTLHKLVDFHPVVWEILQYRECAKLKSTYVDKLPLCIDPADGRVHTTFAQAFTETGRLSSSDPNLQNIPVRSERGKNIRAAIVPRDANHVLVSADYSQIELRLMAAAAKDEAMLAAFGSGADIHRETAARVFGVPAEAVTSEQRSRCKMVNFGIIYGISAFGLAQRLHVTRTEAAELIASYFKLYPAVKSYMDEAIAAARKTGYAVTLLGRRRTLRDINSRNATARQAAERDAINTPIQGTAADLMKLAMVNVRRALAAEGLKAEIVLQIHDELLFDTPRDEVERVSALAKREMERALDVGVPLEVSVGVGDNWLAAH